MPLFDWPIRGDDLNSNSTTRPVHGIAIHAKPHVVCTTTVENGTSMEVSVLHIKTSPQLKTPITVVRIYCYPNPSIKSVKNVLYFTMSKNNLTSTWSVIMGDFNLDSNTNGTGLVTFLKALGFHRYTTNFRTTIDHIYTNIPADLLSTGIFETYYSYHKAIWLAVVQK